ncbi:1,4-alpha-glucan branching protein GlgB [Thermoproteota archaeon]
MNPSNNSVILNADFISDYDIHLFKEGTHYKLFEKLGAHPMELNGVKGTFFAVWAPNAKTVSVIGDFNYWQNDAHFLGVRWDSSGIWEGFIPGLNPGDHYKYHMVSHNNHYSADKGDPYAFYWETPPKTACTIWNLDYKWTDQKWMEKRGAINRLDAPISIYEMHLGSWLRNTEEFNRYLTYKELAPKLTAYLKKLGFTHVEFLPVTEHPFTGSWGYQTTGYFAPTSRYGSPQDFMYLINYLHNNDIAVILDWVPSHFPGDMHGLAYFDGTHLYEHADPKLGFHPDWKSYIFNYNRHEVRNFLYSSAFFWFKNYHIDGLRVDAVASMLYLDYSRKEGEWIPNKYGGRENLEAIEFLKQLNSIVYKEFNGIQMIAEESTAWPMVSQPVYAGGLGFGMKWNMGWMHDTLTYMTKVPIHRKFHHNQLTFSIIYAFHENFILPLSHDEVVHGKGALISKMPGDDWQKFANLRLLYTYMYTHPGKKLLFMGAEIAQWKEWDHDSSLDWHLLAYDPHQQIQRLVQDLNMLYRSEKALFELDTDPQGFAWIDLNNYEQSIICYMRKGRSANDVLVIIANFTPEVRPYYRVGVPLTGTWQELFNSDAARYGGSHMINGPNLQTIPESNHGFYHSLSVTLPPLAVLVLKYDGTHKSSNNANKLNS